MQLWGQHENTREVTIRGHTYEACQAAEQMIRAKEAARMSGDGGFGSAAAFCAVGTKSGACGLKTWPEGAPVGPRCNDA